VRRPARHLGGRRQAKPPACERSRRRRVLARPSVATRPRCYQLPLGLDSGRCWPGERPTRTTWRQRPRRQQHQRRHGAGRWARRPARHLGGRERAAEPARKQKKTSARPAYRGQPTTRGHSAARCCHQPQQLCLFEMLLAGRKANRGDVEATLLGAATRMLKESLAPGVATRSSSWGKERERAQPARDKEGVRALATLPATKAGGVHASTMCHGPRDGGPAGAAPGSRRSPGPKGGARLQPPEGRMTT